LFFFLGFFIPPIAVRVLPHVEPVLHQPIVARGVGGFP
jgi:hypothetical protein